LKIDDSFAAGQIVEYQQVICFLFFSVRIEAFVVEKRVDSLRENNLSYNVLIINAL
jgi:hypothetical protein